MNTAQDLIDDVDTASTRRAKEKMGKFIFMFFCLGETDLHEKIRAKFCEPDRIKKMQKNCEYMKKQMLETYKEKQES